MSLQAGAAASSAYTVSLRVGNVVIQAQDGRAIAVGTKGVLAQMRTQMNPDSDPKGVGVDVSLAAGPTIKRVQVVSNCLKRNLST